VSGIVSKPAVGVPNWIRKPRLLIDRKRCKLRLSTQLRVHTVKTDEAPLWHIFIVDGGSQRRYRASRCEEGITEKFCADLMSGQDALAHWSNAYPQNASKSVASPASGKADSFTPPCEWRTAIHEAGHAVAAIQLGTDGQDFGDVSIVSNGTLSGFFQMSPCGGDTEEVSRHLIVSCSGYGALRALGFDEEFACVGCGDDFEQSNTLIGRHSLAPLEYWKALAVNLFSWNENREAVRLVARELVKAKRLNGEHAQILVEYAVGEISKSDLDKWQFLTSGR
jgi:hypothetical protein